MRKVFNDSRKTYGKRRMQKAIAKEGILLSLETVKRTMRRLQLKANTRRKFKATTNSVHNNYVYPNLLAQNFATPLLNHTWASDISYIKTTEGWLYLCVVIDLCSKSVVGWSMDTRMPQELVLEALKSAFKKRQCAPTIFHSDRGSQYSAAKVSSFLEACGVMQSMSSTGNCFDNAVSESFFATLKKELIYQEKPKDIKTTRNEVFEWIEVFYNQQRIHSSLGDMSPLEYERAA